MSTYGELHKKEIEVIDNHIMYHLLTQADESKIKIFSDKESHLLEEIKILRDKLGKRPLILDFPESICLFCSEK